MQYPLRWLYERDPKSIETYRPDPNYNNLRTEIPVFPWTAENYRFLPGLYTLRWINVLIGAAAVAFNAAALRRLLPDSPRQALAATVFFAFIPQFLHISAEVANDTLGSLAGAVLFWTLARIATDPSGLPGYALAAAAAAALPLGSKLSAIPLGIAVLLAIGLQVRRRWRIPWWVVFLAGLGVAGLVVLAGLLMPDIGRMWLRVIPGRLTNFYEGAFEPASMWMMAKQLAWTFWGQVGWIGAGLPGWMIAGLTLLAAAGFGLTIAAWRRSALDEGGKWALIAALIALAVVFRNSFFTIANQGRLLFPALGPIAYVVVAGWSRILPERVRVRLPWIVGGMWLLVNLWLIFDKIIPIYFQPGLDN
jgi:hypothetical protein